MINVPDSKAALINENNNPVINENNHPADFSDPDPSADFSDPGLSAYFLLILFRLEVIAR